ncbi:hypothetical protein EJ02DRAFT_456563 [Clathrospora elynae]|uniref:Cyclin-dependent kinase n=1 Tax=Clathrospora elynae TaxID=706981 RepID=A0A6A5SGM8_9PLEO|nr:hypothetical protein EJ02DRAFT_456563 [Clathrospora elynae]
MQDADSATYTADTAAVHKSEPQNSQESVQSTVSSTFSAPGLQSSSNLSTSTTAETDSTTTAETNYSTTTADTNFTTTTETDSTTPSSTNAASQRKPTAAPIPDPASEARAGDAHPRIDTATANALRTGDTAASPMSLDAPAAQGSKRTANGSVKGAGRGIDSPSAPAIVHKRNKSMDAHSGTRIGELSAQLKTRLSYAMVKVQNGWEKRSLEELEEVQSQRGSPNSAPGRSDRLALDSPGMPDYRRRPSGVSDNSDQMIMSPVSDLSRSHAAIPAAYWRPGTRPAMNAAANLISITGAQPGYRLAPAPDIQTGRRRRSSGSHVPPSLSGTGQRKHFSDLGSGPRTPATPRAGILRMPSQQAEKDAVDTLLFMSSPNNSQRFPPSGQPVPSPLRADAPQRRVMFEAYPQQEKRGVYQPAMQAPRHHQHAPYPAYPAR